MEPLPLEATETKKKESGSAALFFSLFLVDCKPRLVEAVGEQLFDVQVLFLVVLVQAHDLHVGPELVEHLTARTAGGAVVVAVRSAQFVRP